MKDKKNRYLLLRLRILIAILLKKKLSLLKTFNFFRSLFAYVSRSTISSKYPSVINFSLTNRCNMNCVTCRTAQGDILDLNPNGREWISEEGEISLEDFAEIIDEVKDHLLIAVLYINGEPLLYKGIYEAIKFLSDRRVASMISSNGMLLDEVNVRKLFDSGLDFIKISVSGYSQNVYRVLHRNGDIERIKENLRTLSRLKKEGKRSLVIMVDYILYEHNAFEVNLFAEFCRELGFIFNLRPGYEERTGRLKRAETTPERGGSHNVCCWPWVMLSVNWNREIFSCCDDILWKGLVPYARFIPGKTSIAEVWNGKQSQDNRHLHLTRGRKAIAVCAHCDRRGINFKC